MAKQLRLDVAQLTDIGRKRPHNEDNMAYVIPKDLQVMASKGALFIVADGMGGHAAGEVASEIAVDTVSNVYYQDDSTDVMISLQHAIRRANAAIHQRAAENLLRTGMGTTCVAAALRGNLAFIANVGDSRAYLIRGKQIRLISQDHSWVAEQVRAGLLTEDQARTHAQRNVITRSLGTQPEVEVDIFCEQLQEGDTLLLCSDGLSGFVSDDELLKIVEQFLPQESVYHLVERANENGGPDNITAIIVRVLEAGAEQPNGRYPVPAGGHEEEADTVTLGILPGSPTTYPARNGDLRTPSSPLRLDPVLAPEGALAPQVTASRRPRYNRRTVSIASIVLVVFLILGLGGGVYYYLLQAENQNVQQAFDYAQRQITQAQTQVTTNPATALTHLSNAQKRLRSLQANHQLNQNQNTRFVSLQAQLTTGVRAAISSYNDLAAIKVLPCDPTAPNTVNGGSTTTLAKAIASVQTSPTTSMLYGLGADGNLYRLNQDGTQFTLVSGGFSLPTGAQLLTIAGNGKYLLALESLGTTPQTHSYNLLVFAPPDAAGKLKPPSSLPIAADLTTNGSTPTFLAAWGPNVSVILSSSTNPNTALVLSYTLDMSKNRLLGTAHETQIAVSYGILSAVAFPKQLFLLLAGGSVYSLQLTGKSPAPVQVQVQPPIAPPLVGGDQTFTASMNVPTPTTNVSTPTTGQNSATFLTVPGAAFLAAGQVKSIPHLYLVDPTTHRVIDLQPITSVGTSAPATPPSSSTEISPTLQFLQQYVSSTYLSQVKSLAVDALGTQLDALAQTNPTLWTIVSTSTELQTNCKQ